MIEWVKEPAALGSADDARYVGSALLGWAILGLAVFGIVVLVKRY